MQKDQMSEDSFRELLDPGSTQVFLFTCPATMPFGFARHPWLVVNRKGVVSRWEVFFQPGKCKTSWGYLHKDYFSPIVGIEKYFFSRKYLWKHGIKIVGCVEGDMAVRMADFIENSPEAYPYCHRYSLRGPNSNTYVQWVLREFPESGLRLPWRSFGKTWPMQGPA